MTPSELLEMLRECGYRLLVDGGNLRIRPELPQELLPAVREAKADLVALLEADDEILDVTAREAVWMAGVLPRGDRDQAWLWSAMDRVRANEADETAWLNLQIVVGQVWRRRRAHFEEVIRRGELQQQGRSEGHGQTHGQAAPRPATSGPGEVPHGSAAGCPA